ncbi:MAG: DnaD domain-containing protein [Alkalibacterium gilvum]|uniref:DnaD domain-containing protein n=1 Tax=Alkalibacterium TaxID=99906 RepID=UPI00264850AA|nr:DnaD domain protein [Alkalibacterium sp.]MDN6293809.1 DnaD domain protein [Alkalibacterium sp.]MDN6295505.1 DnaD domain protein [Alkalibacterium sp.]MDN6385378.1 DnaD domain protein [Alkalibacterium sp.]MDN6397705.1 DnaD domain protein [Alkalibacterium sp.]
MNKQLLFEWISSGTLSVPNYLLKHYKKIGLDNNDLVTLLQLLSLVENGQRFPDSQLLADRLDITREDAFKAIHQLITKKVLTIETKADEEGKTVDEFSFDLLYDKLSALLIQTKENEESEKEVLASKNIYQLFEQEFGRSLSAMEIQTLNMWIEEDKYKPELIEMALREAVLNQVYSLKYIDRILLSWEKKNIRTKEQVEKESKRFRKSQSNDNSKEKSDPNETPVPMYNWLKDKLDN